MNQKFEIEYKTLISDTNAANLLSLGIFEFLNKQTNVYFDTEDNYFHSNKVVLRLREKKEITLFTAKQSTNDGLLETEFELIDDKSIENTKIAEFLSQFRNKKPLHEIGSTITYRYTYKDEFGEWCLDFNVFDYTSDVELEYELNKGETDRMNHFKDQLKKWGVPFDPCSSKYIRMLEQKDKNQP